MFNRRFFSFVFSVFLALVLIWIYFDVISFGGLCGWEDGHMVENKGLGLECECLGITSNTATSYSEKTYCTGLNFSYNGLLNTQIFRNSQRPVYTESGAVRTLKISVISGVNSYPINNGTVVVSDKEEEMIREFTLDGSNEAVFLLPEGDYKVSMKSGYTGEENISLDQNKKAELTVLQLVN